MPPQPPEPSTAGLPEFVLDGTSFDDLAGFCERFGVDVVSIYNMTELSAPIISEWNPTVEGSCGRVRPGCEIRLVDAHDREVEKY